MFWSKKQNEENKSDKRPSTQAGVRTGCELKTGAASLQSGGAGGETSNGQRIREEALANARAARAHIGEDTLNKIAAAMEAKKRSATEQAKARIVQSEADRVAMEILAMLDKR